MRIVIDGERGSGKTSLAKAISSIKNSFVWFLPLPTEIHEIAYGAVVPEDNPGKFIIVVRNKNAQS